MSPRERIAGARLYLVCDARPREFLAAAIRGGVDTIQLRDKALADEEVVTAAREFRAAADARRRAVRAQRPAGPRRRVRRRWRPRRPGGRLARRGARGRRAGGDRRALDARARPVQRRRCGPRRRLPRRRPGARDADEAGPPAAGLGYIEYAAAHARKPWFAIGGLDAGNAHEVVGARGDAVGGGARDHGLGRPGGRRARSCARCWRTAMGKRSRKARTGARPAGLAPAGGERPAEPAPGEDRMARGYARARESATTPVTRRSWSRSPPASARSR